MLSEHQAVLAAVGNESQQSQALLAEASQQAAVTIEQVRAESLAQVEAERSHLVAQATELLHAEKMNVVLLQERNESMRAEMAQRLAAEEAARQKLKKDFEQALVEQRELHARATWAAHDAARHAGEGEEPPLPPADTDRFVIHTPERKVHAGGNPRPWCDAFEKRVRAEVQEPSEGEAGMPPPAQRIASTKTQTQTTTKTSGAGTSSAAASGFTFGLAP